MKRLEELVKNRQLEIEAAETSAREDQVNFAESIGLGALGVAIGGLVAYVASVIAFGVITFVYRVIYEIFLSRTHGPWSPLEWGGVFTFLVTMIGIGIGWFAGYGGHRKG